MKINFIFIKIFFSGNSQRYFKNFEKIRSKLILLDFGLNAEKAYVY